MELIVVLLLLLEHMIWDHSIRQSGDVSITEQLHGASQEMVLKELVKFLALSRMPLLKRTLAPKVFALCGKTPSCKWIYRFLHRHVDCTLGRPIGLDPARAKCFNHTTVNQHFNHLQNVFNSEGIPLCNLHNFDEIGCQIGGGRKDTGELYLFATCDQSRYKIKSDDLELVTILETVCTNGTSTIKPCFIFFGVQHMEDWYEAEDGIVYAFLVSLFLVFLTKPFSGSLQWPMAGQMTISA